jgi:hypothetical protein
MGSMMGKFDDAKYSVLSANKMELFFGILQN